MEPSLGIAWQKISRAYCWASYSAFEFSPARSPNGPYSKVSRAPRLPFWIELATGSRDQCLLLDHLQWTTQLRIKNGGTRVTFPGAGSKHVQVRTVTFIRPPQHFGCDEPNGACRQR